MDVMITTPTSNLEAFAHWLPLERWVADQLLTAPIRNLHMKRQCKVCDAFVEMADADKHATFHRQEMRTLKRKKAAAAAKRSKQGLATARREKRLASVTNG